jgi:hypothetical protein
MEESDNKTTAGNSLGIDRLMSNLEQAKNEQNRLAIKHAYQLFHQIRHELPYAQAIPAVLFDCLIADSPQQSASTALNEVLVNLGSALLNPYQKEAIVTLAHAYLQQRKRSGKEYASAMLSVVLNEAHLQPFPEHVHSLLKELAQDVIEKVINEKQMRQIPGYRLQPVLELGDSFLYRRLFHADLEQVRERQFFEFRKLIHMLVQEGYEKTNDESRLDKIHQEKMAAFEVFSTAIIEKVPMSFDLANLQNKIKFLQRDERDKLREFKKKIIALLVPLSSTSMQNTMTELMARFDDVAADALYNVDQDPQIYDNEEVMKQVHEKALKNCEEHVRLIIDLVAVVVYAEEQYKKGFLNWMSGKKHLTAVEDVLLNAVLGRPMLRVDPASGGNKIVRVGGYPDDLISDIYAKVIDGLTKVAAGLSGMFLTKLKEELEQAIQRLGSMSHGIKEDIVEEISAPVVVSRPEIQVEVKAPEPEIKLEIVVPQAEPTPDIKVEEIESNFKLEAIAPVAEPEFKLETITPGVAPEPQIEVDASIATEKSEPTIEIPLPSELTNEVTFGLSVIKNYKLGHFQPAVQAAWEKLITSTAKTRLPIENEIRLYEICNVVQGVASIQSANLPSEKQSLFQDLNAKLKEALNNPLAEKNWGEVNRLVANFK